MPLKRGRSQDVISENIAELLRSYSGKGTIGRIKPMNKAHAREIASAIAYRKARESGYKGRPPEAKSKKLTAKPKEKSKKPTAEPKEIRALALRIIRKSK